jgi:hypothetical protein
MANQPLPYEILKNIASDVKSATWEQTGEQVTNLTHRNSFNIDFL